MGTNNFLFVILNVILVVSGTFWPSPLSDITQFLVQFNARWILQLIKGLFNDLQILLKYFSRTTIFAFYNVPPAAAFPKILDFYLKHDEIFLETLSGFPASVTVSLLNCHKLPHVWEYLLLYSIKLCIGIIISTFAAVSMCSSFIWVTHLVNGAQFLNATSAFSILPVTVIYPVRRIYASEKWQRLDLTTFVSNLMLESFSFPSQYSVLFLPLMTYYFLVANFEDSLSVSFNKFTIIWVSILYIVND